jgi:hypothetical protein
MSASLNRLLVFGTQLLLLVRGPASIAAARLSLGLWNGQVLHLPRSAWRAVSLAATSNAAHPAALIGVDTRAFGAFAGSLGGASLRLIVDDVAWGEPLTVGRFTRDDLSGDAVVMATAAIASGLAPAPLAILFQPQTQWLAAGQPTTVRFHVDTCVHGANGSVIEGWASHVSPAEVLIATEDFAFVIDPRDWLPRARTDVAGHLSTRGYDAKHRGEHGFMVSFPPCPGLNRLYFVHASPAAPTVIGPVPLDAIRVFGDPLTQVFRAAQAETAATRRVAARMARAHVRLPLSRPTARGLVAQPETAAAACSASVLLPIRSTIGILAVQAMRKLLPSALDVVAICETPALAEDLMIREQLAGEPVRQIRRLCGPEDLPWHHMTSDAATGAADVLVILPWPAWLDDAHPLMELIEAIATKTSDAIVLAPAQAALGAPAELSAHLQALEDPDTLVPASALIIRQQDFRRYGGFDPDCLTARAALCRLVRGLVASGERVEMRTAHGIIAAPGADGGVESDALAWALGHADREAPWHGDVGAR